MRILGLLAVFATIAAITLIGGGEAWANGQPEPWQLGFQEAATPMMERITSFHNGLLVMVFGVSAFVLVLLIYAMLKFNMKANPVPAKFSHNSLIEVIWTGIPILILVIIAVPSFRLIYFIDEAPKGPDGQPQIDLTLKATGYQWSWGYQYPDEFGDEEFIANMVPDEELNGRPRLLAADFEIVVPVDKNVQVIVAAADVIHNWAMPAFGIKMDAVPGRLNETWFRATKTGTFYGQCSELCGQGHAFMPITLKVVSEAEYIAWTQQIKNEYGIADNAAKSEVITLAAAE